MFYTLESVKTIRLDVFCSVLIFIEIVKKTTALRCKQIKYALILGVATLDKKFPAQGNYKMLFLQLIVV